MIPIAGPNVALKCNVTKCREDSMDPGSSALKPSGHVPHSKTTAFGQILLLLGLTIGTIVIGDFL